MTESEKKLLVEKALEARKFAYVPYDDFRVGAALLCDDGTIVTGCNIQNAAHTPNICAERTAFAKAVSEGKKKFSAIAIVGGPGEEEPKQLVAPCGVCRQVFAEFCDPDKFVILLGKGDKTWEEYRLIELFPLGFSGKDLGK